MREAQVNCARNTPNCDIAILLDISDSTFMHGPIKEVVGERFAYIALAQTYGMKGFEYSDFVLFYFHRLINGTGIFKTFHAVGLC